MLTPLTDDDPRTVGPYRLRSRIGAGGMGVVYLGFDSGGRAAAVKVPYFGHVANAEFRKRFRVGVAAARRVVGAHVAHVIDAEADGRRPWLAAEYVEGRNLQAAIDGDGPLVGDRLDRLVVGIAKAITVIHGAGAVHHDLKPENILLAPTGIKVVDFGITRSIDFPGITQAGGIIDTVAWMAPEQFEGGTPGPAVDIFAWGSCVVFAATGRHPFPGNSPRSIATAIKNVNSEPILYGVPDRLLPAVRAALAKSPDLRPTAPELLNMLDDLLSPAHDDDSPPSDDFTGKFRRTYPGSLPPVSQPPDFPAPTELIDRARTPLSTFILLLAAGFLFAAGIGLAVANAPLGDFVGLAAVAGAVTVLAVVLTTPNGFIGAGMIALAAATGAAAGLILSRFHDIDQPYRMLLQLAGALLLATVFARIMRR